MFEKETDQPDKSKDRKLGDEWTDWDGESDSGVSDIDETITTFFVLSSGIILILIAAVLLGWYLIKPRIDQLGPSVSILAGWGIAGLCAIFLLLILVEAISLLNAKKSPFPYGLTEKLFLFLLPKTIWLGRKFGISRDRIGNSFLKVNNLITKSYALNPERPLVLLPRCLKKEARSLLMNRLDGDAFKILTAGGGEEARKAIRQYRPTLILALACERDLMSGIKDVAEKVPVLAIPNKRPEGPCKNTEFAISELDDALRFIEERKKQKQ